MRARALVLGMVVSMPVTALGGKADVVEGRAIPLGGGSYRFEVTVHHDDAGWNHFADRWEVLKPGGGVLGVRVLHHPHVEEQPFTRALLGIEVPAGVTTVRIRARDSVHGFGGREIVLELP